MFVQVVHVYLSPYLDFTSAGTIGWESRVSSNPGYILGFFNVKGPGMCGHEISGPQNQLDCDAPCGSICFWELFIEAIFTIGQWLYPNKSVSGFAFCSIDYISSGDSTQFIYNQDGILKPPPLNNTDYTSDIFFNTNIGVE
ncbi:hypothetical protein GL2_19200 [Microbulbifer sp. GL-2]|nr:hypothetical protein GL2_19200 [Microbulbifer sp. GL-2]